jgi:hypothetical protein
VQLAVLGQLKEFTDVIVTQTCNLQACSIVSQQTMLPCATSKKLKPKHIHTAAVISAVFPDVEVSVLNVSWNTIFFCIFPRFT